MSKRFKLNANDILSKQFHIDFKGYSAKEVDEYLDLIIQDYEEYERMIKELGERLNEFEEKTKELQRQLELSHVKEKNDETSSQELVQNLDVLKRISRLEEKVFNNK